MTAFKKPLSGILAAILVFVLIAAAPISVFAEDEIPSLSAQEIELNKETDGDYEYVKIDEGSAIELIRYIGSETEVSIPGKINNISVTTIGAGCFEGNSTVVEVKLNSAIVTVKDAAFKDCTALKEVKKTESLTSLGVSCFEGCTALEEFEFPESVTLVPEKCFAGCTALAEIKAHKNLKGAAADAFTGTVYENNMPDGALVFGRILYSYKGNVADLVVPEGVSVIEDYAFLGNESLKTLTLGPDVEEIGLYAFQNCVNLESIAFDEAIGIIDSGAFKGCTALKAVEFADTTLATIGYESFADCTSLATVTLPETVSAIGDYAFANTVVSTVDFGKNVSEIGVNTFDGDVALESINVVDKNKTFSSVDGVLYSDDGKALILFPAAKKGDFVVPASVEEIREDAFEASALNNVTFEENSALSKIGANAFSGSDITAINLPLNVTKINSATFKNAEKLAEVTFNEGLEYIGSYAFEGCTALKDIVLPDTLKDIATGAFAGTGLVSVATGNGVANIDSKAFADNAKLTKLSLGDNVKSIGEGAFEGCEALTAVVLPASLRSFSADAFAGCKALAKISVAKENDNYKSVGSAIYTADGKTLVLAGNAKTQSLIINKGTQIIAADAFAVAVNVADITFPASLLTVKANALDVTAWYKAASGAVYAGSLLYRVKGDMADLAVAEGTVAIADNAVNNPTVKTVILPETLTYIGNAAFAETSIKEIVIPAKVTFIGSGAFENAVSLKKVTLSNALETIGSSAFKGCVALTSLVVPETVKAIAADTFAGCLKLGKVELRGVETIGKYAFSGCASLKELALPETLTELDPVSFVGCTALEAVNVENALYKSVDGVVLVANEEGAFNTIALYPAGKQGEYTIPADVTNIADRAFYDCDGLTGIVFADGFNNIGAEAFYDCDAITSLELPESARDIGDHAFASCDELREFIVNSNLTDYADNAFEGCYYFNYDAVTIHLAESSGSFVGIVVVVVIVIAVVAFLVYRKKQKKAEAEFNAKQKETAKAE